ncbi:MAG: hypothetical protein LBD16_07935 [Oscillospiraceae bacterium]|nr:hypothetical protein [Oscillospiraceae bacterium]
MIVIGLLPIKASFALSVSRDRNVYMAATIGPVTIRPKFGQGKAGLTWAKKLTSKLKPPVPIKRLVRIIASDVYMSDFNVEMLLGLDEASATAIAAGVVQSVIIMVGMALKAMSESANSEKSNVNVKITPDWSRLAFGMDAEVVLRSRLGRFVHLIGRLAWLSLIASIKKPKRSIKMVSAIQNNA